MSDSKKPDLPVSEQKAQPTTPSNAPTPAASTSSPSPSPTSSSGGSAQASPLPKDQATPLPKDQASSLPKDQATPSTSPVQAKFNEPDGGGFFLEDPDDQVYLDWLQDFKIRSSGGSSGARQCAKTTGGSGINRNSSVSYNQQYGKTSNWGSAPESAGMYPQGNQTSTSKRINPQLGIDVGGSLKTGGSSQGSSIPRSFGYGNPPQPRQSRDGNSSCGFSTGGQQSRSGHQPSTGQQRQSQYTFSQAPSLPYSGGRGYNNQPAYGSGQLSVTRRSGSGSYGQTPRPAGPNLTSGFGGQPFSGGMPYYGGSSSGSSYNSQPSYYSVESSNSGSSSRNSGYNSGLAMPHYGGSGSGSSYNSQPSYYSVDSSNSASNSRNSGYKSGTAMPHYGGSGSGSSYNSQPSYYSVESSNSASNSRNSGYKSSTAMPYYGGSSSGSSFNSQPSYYSVMSGSSASNSRNNVPSSAYTGGRSTSASYNSRPSYYSAPSSFGPRSGSAFSGNMAPPLPYQPIRASAPANGYPSQGGGYNSGSVRPYYGGSGFGSGYKSQPSYTNEGSSSYGTASAGSNQLPEAKPLVVGSDQQASSCDTASSPVNPNGTGTPGADLSADKNSAGANN